jgi:hypothetical protein
LKARRGGFLEGVKSEALPAKEYMLT